MKTLKAIVSFLGPLGTIVAVLAASVGVTFVLRSTVRGVSEFFAPKVIERVGGDAGLHPLRRTPSPVCP